jgi:hypothetical protein
VVERAGPAIEARGDSLHRVFLSIGSGHELAGRALDEIGGPSESPMSEDLGGVGGGRISHHDLIECLLIRRDYYNVKTVQVVAPWATEHPTRTGKCFDELVGIIVARYEWRYRDAILEICALTDFTALVYDAQKQAMVEKHFSLDYSRDLRVLWMSVRDRALTLSE